MSNLRNSNKHSIDNKLHTIHPTSDRVQRFHPISKNSKKPSNTIRSQIQQEITKKNRLRHEWRRNQYPATKRKLNAKIFFHSNHTSDA